MTCSNIEHENICRRIQVNLKYSAEESSTTLEDCDGVSDVFGRNAGHIRRTGSTVT